MALRRGRSSRAAEILNPMNSCYRDSQGKWFWLLGLQGDRMWPAVARVAGLAELVADPRFDSMEARANNCAELTSLLDAAFATRPLDEWAPIFEREDIWWTPVNDGHDLLKDPQLRAAGGLASLPTTQGKEVEIIRRRSISTRRRGRFAAPLRSWGSIPRRSCSSWGATGTRSRS